MAFLAPLAEIQPATRASRIALGPPRFRRSVLVLAVVAVFGAGAAVATTISRDPVSITVTEQNGSTHQGLFCDDPPQDGQYTFKDFNGIPGHQPGEPCPEIIPLPKKPGHKGDTPRGAKGVTH